MLENIILGIVQGLTEFFPVSSSGHLIIFQNAFGMKEAGIYTEVFLHTGTLLAVVVVFYRDIIDILKGFLSSFGVFTESVKYKKAAWFLILANVPAGLVGIFFKEFIENLFSGNYIVYILLIVTGLVLFAGRYFKAEKYDINNMGWLKTVIIGISQAVAILPGISRSGITITTGAFVGLKRSEAAKFSFLMMIPAVAGATLLEILEFKNLPGSSINLFELGAGVIASFIVGYIALKLLLAVVKNYKLHYFAYYCAALGLTGLFFF
ncbi:MAG: undecaprenyl-diphosphatase UppP [Elusimicrobia bacterium]|jgi:undecaprenyl-diphosphatase|nr:undecaprenyl-diphosphatase UppP [Elusimicrobiota bacterium]